MQFWADIDLPDLSGEKVRCTSDCKLSRVFENVPGCFGNVQPQILVTQINEIFITVQQILT